METGRREGKRDGKGGRGQGRLYLHSNSSQVNGILFRTRIVATENMPVCLGEREKERRGGGGGGGTRRGEVSINFFFEEQDSTSLIPRSYIIPDLVLGMRLRLFIAYVCIQELQCK